ncbi:hypothetical protein DYD21_08960 [Rhodohalobacter sp. SW132]|uniref:antiviral reverse transcriptase Drt2 n=1 Tax=Rhodohalobacter sp. SW132 TaxID=2293433 RepID=UPI000E22E074|nr:antiviral reverse transcriptase Drt2 [Rhodohalobacter sp. SW132]REL37899.1 hypothetical protein DYD21_08960 [Rhodohalobacter sp. SW132]
MNRTDWYRFIDKETNSGGIPEGKRRYLHFDRKINFNSFANSLKKFLSDPDKVSSKSFYPFIKQVIQTPRYKVINRQNNEREMDAKEREIYYASHFDSLVYSYYSILLDRKYEELISEQNISDSVTAYRKLGKNNVDFAKEAFDYIKNKGECVAIAFDITGFFDNLDHKILKKAWCKVLEKGSLPEDHYNIFKTLTKFSFVLKNDLDTEFSKRISSNHSYRICNPKEFRENVRAKGLVHTNLNKFGIPQGSPMSAVLSNIYMLEFDQEMCNLIDRKNGLYRRYSDDILIVVDVGDLASARNYFYELVNKFNLESKEEKECIRIFKVSNGVLKSFDQEENEKCLQYLGFTFDGSRTLVRSSSISRYYRKMRNNVRLTVKKTFGKKSRSSKVSKRKLYKRFTHKGIRGEGISNFIGYVYKANEKMGGKDIRSQVSGHVDKLNEAIEKKYDKIKNKKSSN